MEKDGQTIKSSLKSFFHKGDVVVVDLGKIQGSEKAGKRPAVIVQNEIGNILSSTVIIVPLTGAENIKKEYPFHVYIPKGEACLEKDSIASCENIRVLDKRHIIETKGRLRKSIINNINEAIKFQLALESRFEPNEEEIEKALRLRESKNP